VPVLSIATTLTSPGHGKAIRDNERGEVTDFILNDKSRAGTGSFIEVIAEALNLVLCEVGQLSLESTKTIAFSSACTVFVLLKRVRIEDKFVSTGGIAKNVGVTTRIQQKLGGTKITIPPEPQIAGAVGAALLALDRARQDTV
jgi:activator of 2-hydroxyglutaryl-CoA dehydratase